jgi:hypothetical protein
MRSSRFSLSVDGRTVEVTMRRSGARQHSVRTRASDGGERVIGRLTGCGDSWLADSADLSQPIVGTSAQSVCAGLVRVATIAGEPRARA